MVSRTAWDQLAEPFPDSEVKQRPGRGGMTFSYVDARAVMQRLDDVLTPEGWSFRCTPSGGIVRGSLSIYVGERELVREDIGYPNGPDDEEPLKSAASDALKRCAVHFGVGRHLYTDSHPPRPAAVTSSSTAAGTRAVQGDGSWVCPEHGGGRVKANRRGLFCATKVGETGDGKAIWCQHTDQEKPIEARPAPADDGPPPDWDELIN